MVKVKDLTVGYELIREDAILKITEIRLEGGSQYDISYDILDPLFRDVIGWSFIVIYKSCEDDYFEDHFRKPGEPVEEDPDDE